MQVLQTYDCGDIAMAALTEGR